MYAAPKKLRPRLRIVLQLLESGMKHTDIAKLTGYHPNRIYQIATMRDVRIQEIRKQARTQIEEGIIDLGQRFRAMAAVAFERQVELMKQTEDKATARLASKYILEVAGYSPVRKQATITAQVPQQEFIDAVARMEKTDEVERRAEEWNFRLPEKTNDHP